MLRSANVIMGAGVGAKNSALAALTRVVQQQFAADITVRLIEKVAAGANWSGCAGLTDGEFPLDTAPLKDLGFPYISGYGPSVDRELGHYSIIEFLKEKRLFPAWVSRGMPSISHKLFAEYQQWGVQKSLTAVQLGEVTHVEPSGRQVRVTLRTSREEQETVTVNGIVLTGPGDAKRVRHQDDDPDLIFDARSYWLRRALFRGLENGRVAVIGSGQSAATAAKSILLMNPSVSVDIYNRRGFLVAQSAGFFENALCSDPNADWEKIPIDERREMMARINHGVVDTSVKSFLDQHPNVSVIRGSVEKIIARQNHAEVQITNCSGSAIHGYDRVVVAIGFDFMDTLRRLLPAELTRSSWFLDLTQNPSVDYHLRLQGLECNIHTPPIAGLSQGPGLQLISCLGTVASRILSAYVPLPKGASHAQ
jgi:mycobactin lysine-N-oxygenase